jgi:hypothetical protein
MPSPAILDTSAPPEVDGKRNLLGYIPNNTLTAAALGVHIYRLPSSDLLNRVILSGIPGHCYSPDTLIFS